MLRCCFACRACRSGSKSELPARCVHRQATGWTAFELTWLDPQGKPEVAILSFDVPATSSAIVESKSVKLYLGSFAQTRFAGRPRRPGRLARDLSAARRRAGAGDAGCAFLLRAAAYRRVAWREPGWAWPWRSIATWSPRTCSPQMGPPVTETLRTDLFRSLCPVTGQPDFASIGLAYRGPRIDRAGLLRYLVSYRNHAGFHEHCAERIFVDVMARAAAKRCRSTRDSRAVAVSTSIRSAPARARRRPPTCATRGNDLAENQIALKPGRNLRPGPTWRGRRQRPLR